MQNKYMKKNNYIKNIMLKKQKRFTQSLSKGFTLIETLVAIMILSLVITSVISLTSSSIFSARYAKNEIKAMYIAQEGIDYIRNLRDSLAFQQGSWATFTNDLNSQCGGVDGCTIKKPFLSGHFTSLQVSPAVTTPITKNGEFRNTINVECVTLLSSCDSVNIISKVEWRNGEVEKIKELKASLTMWN